MAYSDNTVKTVAAISGVVIITVAGVLTGHNGAVLNSAMLLLAGLGGYFGAKRNGQ